MIVIIYLINLILPITTFAGLFGLVGLMQGYFSDSLWVVSGVCAAVGFFYGIFSWSYGVPLRWFYVMSPLGLFDTMVGNVISCSLQFFLAPLGIACISYVIELID